ncbi:DUF3891 family protein [Chroococcidiopsis sp. TS-821]|uniref:DUF3891 family protein n=1 Tax=Chroococcidiopsis sp. TS-821 TaxID=1378066 RepID=UPI000CEEFDBF|nr:DUF3891 family protein [Chroococcidiopsis sp. TS-821]PPS43345.1 hypothetical protein B1A85_11640 [Chroococcidiopsis sp. TS-821]
MLHRQESAGLVVITQPTHSWVAGCIARVWGNEKFGVFAPREEVCLGAEQHDIGWVVWETAPTLNPKTGYPYNFMELPTETHTKIWSGAKQLALPFGRYATLLVSLHGTGLFERRNWQTSLESSRLVQAYLDQEYAFQEQLIANLECDSYYAAYATPENIQRNRSLVATWDTLSLALCMGLREEKKFHQVPTALGEITLTLTPVEENVIKVSPWVFQQDTVKLVYEGRLLQKKFTDEAAMRQALNNASWVNITNTLISN